MALVYNDTEQISCHYNRVRLYKRSLQTWWRVEDPWVRLAFKFDSNTPVPERSGAVVHGFGVSRLTFGSRRWV
jgi:hypothetical protein